MVEKKQFSISYRYPAKKHFFHLFLVRKAFQLEFDFLQKTWLYKMYGYIFILIELGEVLIYMVTKLHCFFLIAICSMAGTKIYTSQLQNNSDLSWNSSDWNMAKALFHTPSRPKKDERRGKQLRTSSLKKSSSIRDWQHSMDSEFEKMKYRKYKHPLYDQYCQITNDINIYKQLSNAAYQKGSDFKLICDNKKMLGKRIRSSLLFDKNQPIDTISKQEVFEILYNNNPKYY